MEKKQQTLFIIDFDGCVVKHAFPEIGENIGAQAVLRKLVTNDHKIILNTSRNHTDGTIDEAVQWFKDNEIPLSGVNFRPQLDPSNPYAYVIIDDSALGCPLIQNHGQLPYVDWVNVHFQLDKLGYFNS